MGRKAKRAKFLLRQKRLLGIDLDPKESRRVGLGYVIDEQERAKAELEAKVLAEAEVQREKELEAKVLAEAEVQREKELEAGRCDELKEEVKPTVDTLIAETIQILKEEAVAIVEDQKKADMVAPDIQAPAKKKVAPKRKARAKKVTPKKK